MLQEGAVFHSTQVYFSRESIDARWVNVRRIGSIRRVSAATPSGPVLRPVSPVPHAAEPASHADLPIRLPTIPGRGNGHGGGAISRLAKGGQHQCQNHVTGELSKLSDTSMYNFRHKRGLSPGRVPSIFQTPGSTF